jgi:hypothetical protein
VIKRLILEDDACPVMLATIGSALQFIASNHLYQVLSAGPDGEQEAIRCIIKLAADEAYTQRWVMEHPDETMDQVQEAFEQCVLRHRAGGTDGEA